MLRLVDGELPRLPVVLPASSPMVAAGVPAPWQSSSSPNGCAALPCAAGPAERRTPSGRSRVPARPSRNETNRGGGRCDRAPVSRVDGPRTKGLRRTSPPSSPLVIEARQPARDEKQHGDREPADEESWREGDHEGAGQPPRTTASGHRSGTSGSPAAARSAGSSSVTVAHRMSRSMSK